MTNPPIPIPGTLIEGERHNVEFARTGGGEWPAFEYLRQLNTDDPKCHDNLIALLDRVANHGLPLSNDRKCKHLDDGIYELKSSRGHRLLLFGLHQDWYLTQGCPKMSTRAFQAEIKRAKNIRTEHLERLKKQGTRR
jgi:hypothetical protein